METWFNMGQLSCLSFPCLSTWQHLLSDTFICPHRILTFDVGSQQPEWKKCIHCFDSITSIISLHCTEQIQPGAFGGVKNCQFTPLSLCATSADSSFCTTELDDKVACPVWEHHQQAAVPTHVDHPLPQHHQGIQEHTPQAVSSCTFATIYVIWLCVFASLQVLLEKYFPQYSLGPILTKCEIHIMALHVSKLGIIERISTVSPHLLLPNSMLITTCNSCSPMQTTDTIDIWLVFAAVKEMIFQNALKDFGIL